MRAPLKKIVDRGRNAVGSNTETLECGHVVHERHDHMGATNAERRRCKRCAENPAKGYPPEGGGFNREAGQ